MIETGYNCGQLYLLFNRGTTNTKMTRRKNAHKEVRETIMKSLIYCCLEHVDVALDDVVDETGEPPILNKVERENELSTGCEYCQNQAIYVVGNTHSDTICGQ